MSIYSVQCEVTVRGMVTVLLEADSPEAAIEAIEKNRNRLVPEFDVEDTEDLLSNGDWSLEEIFDPEEVGKPVKES